MTYDEPKGAYWHIENLALTESGPYLDFVNYVQVTDDSSHLVEKVGEMIAGIDKDAPGDAYAIHIRRIPQPEDGVHLYDETQPLAVAQSDALRYRRAFEALTKRYSELETAKQRMEEGYEREIAILERRIGRKGEENERQAMRLERIHYRARRDLECCVTMEPSEILAIFNGQEDESIANTAEALREKLTNILPTEPMPEKFSSDNQYKAALAEWGVYEQIAEALGVTIPLEADGE